MSTLAAAATGTTSTGKQDLVTIREGSEKNIIPTFKLASGYEMPVVAYGTFRSNPGEVYDCIMNAIKIGYRHFDCAHVYGNEKEIGKAFNDAIFGEQKLVTRDELFITGKLWNSDHGTDIVSTACDYSLNNLGIDYFDLYLIHFPIAWKHTGIDTPGWGKSELDNDTSLIDTWRAMEKLVASKKCRSIGVSNYPLLLLHDLTCQANVPVSCNQIETHVYYQRESLINYCLSRNICVTAHTPLGGGNANEVWTNSSSPIDDPIVKEIAAGKENKNVTPAQVLLRFLLQSGVVVLPKSIKKSRMEENITLFGMNLSDDEMNKLRTLDKYVSYKTNPNPLESFIGGPDCFTDKGTDIFD